MKITTKHVRNSTCHVCHTGAICRPLLPAVLLRKLTNYLTALLEAIFIISMVMVVEGGGLDHGILCTIMGDGMRGEEQNITPFKIINEGVGGLGTTQSKN